MIRNAQDVLNVAKRRGFQVLMNPGPPPMPILRGDPKEATPALMQALKAWRVEIMDLLSKEGPTNASNPLHG